MNRRVAAAPVIGAGLLVMGCGSTGTVLPTPTQSTGASTPSRTPAAPTATLAPAAYQAQVCAAIADGKARKWTGAYGAWLAAEGAAGSVDFALSLAFAAAASDAIPLMSGTGTSDDIAVYQRAVAALPSETTAPCAP